MFDDFSMPSLTCSTVLNIFVSVSILGSDAPRIGCLAYPLLLFFPFLLFSLHRIMGKSIRLCSFVKLLWILNCVVVVSGRPRIVSRHHSSGITDLI